MESTVKQRLKEFLRIKKLSQCDFCKAIGVNRTYISNMRSSIAPDKIERITQQFPELNITWLLTGTGGMILARSNIEGIEQEEKSEEYEKALAELKSKNDDLYRRYVELLEENRMLRIELENRQRRAGTA